MNKQTYNDIKWTVQLSIPALASLYFVVDVIWDLPYALRVVGILSVINLILGLVLRYYAKRNLEYDGEMIVSRRQNGSSFVLELDGDPYDLQNKDSVTFKVTSISPED
jgi:hypothetical protein